MDLVAGVDLLAHPDQEFFARELLRWLEGAVVALDGVTTKCRSTSRPSLKTWPRAAALARPEGEEPREETLPMEVGVGAAAVGPGRVIAGLSWAELCGVLFML
jgi:hypothetical protein